jgi:chemotaxis family two-component system sensor kinase Cph1
LNDLFGAARPLNHLDELPGYFTDQDAVRLKLRALCDTNAPWRGEAVLTTDQGKALPVAVRADPVLASRDRVLGFVLLFTDLTERKAAASARERFRDNVMLSQRRLMGNPQFNAAFGVEKLMSNIIDNAQLAALEIADGLDTASIPESLESLRASVARAAEVLEQISRAAAQAKTAESEESGEEA